MSAGQIIQWQDLFVVVDDATIPIPRYAAIEAAMRQQASLFHEGIACLVILPPGTKPPSDDVQRAVKGVLTRMEPQLTCLGYLVEGTGFKAVAARASLIGMKIFAQRSHPIYVETSMLDVLSRMLPHMAKGKTITRDLGVIERVIADCRMPPLGAQPAPSRVDVTTK